MIRVYKLLNLSVLVIICISLTHTAYSITERDKREEAFQKDRRNCTQKYQWATTAQCTTALCLYKEIADSIMAPDSLRALSYGTLGEYYYTSKDYNKAAQMFQSASKLTSSNRYRHLWALSLFQLQDYESAQSLWHTLALENRNEYSLISNFYTGLIYLRQEKFAAACSSFIKCGVPDKTKPITIDALSAKHYCSVKLGRDDEANKYSEQLKKIKHFVWIDWSSDGDVVQKSDITAMTKNNDVLTKENFSVQVGAFGSKENAYSLQKKMSDTFKNVTVATVKLDDKIFYRVRIGTFATKELAEKFAIDSVQKAGYNGKAVLQE